MVILVTSTLHSAFQNDARLHTYVTAWQVVTVRWVSFQSGNRKTLSNFVTKKFQPFRAQYYFTNIKNEDVNNRIFPLTTDANNIWPSLFTFFKIPIRWKITVFSEQAQRKTCMTLQKISSRGKESMFSVTRAGNIAHSWKQLQNARVRNNLRSVFRKK